MFISFFNHRVLTPLLLVASISAALMPQAQAETAQRKSSYVQADAIVAVVNKDVITRMELDKRVRQIESDFKKQGRTLPVQAVLKKQVLEKMIMEQIQLQKAKSMGLRVSDKALDASIVRLAAQNNTSPEKIRADLEKEGQTYADFREQIRGQIIMRRLRESKVDNKVQVLDSDVESFMAGAKNEEAKPQFHLAHILVRIPEKASSEQIKLKYEKALMIQSELQAGKDFNEMTVMHSEANDALKGGDLGWRTQEQLPTAFSNAISRLKAGEVSSLIKTANGFHLVKVVDRRKTGDDPSNIPAVQQTHAHHILIKVNEIVSEADARRKLVEIKARIENSAATFADLARLFSNDLSASKGGDLGWVYPGDMVPEFERAMQKLAVGEISQPVKSPFGMHLIQVTERKVDEASQERLRMATRKTLRQRKIEEASREWLRQLRDSAYVEYR